jgi:ketosteroid isomerase-like protein
MTTVIRKSLSHIITPFAIVLVSLIASSCASKTDATSADLEAVNSLHQRDMEASRKWDVDTLSTLWADDIVTLSQGDPPMIGKEANRAAMLRLRDDTKDLQIADYITSFNEVKIVGDWAFEWGTYSGTVKPLAGGESVRSSGKVMRVLKKDKDGAWKIARAMYDSDEM